MLSRTPSISDRPKTGCSNSSADSISPQTTIVFLVQLPEAIGNAVRHAARETFSEAKFIETKSTNEALELTLAGNRQLLVLRDTDEAEIGLATQATDARHLPRWTVVILGGNSSDLAESVPLKECHPPLLARVFRSAMQQHELLRENLQLRGDLKTVARRVRHDLLSPLNCVYISCELLKELLANAAPTVQSQIEVIHRSVADTCLLLDRVSEILKASADPLPIACVNMDAIVDRTLHVLDAEVKQRRAVIHRPSTWPEVMGVEKWLETIWWNLIVNALRHGRPLSAIQLGWDQDTQFMRFWVENQGESVPSDIEGRFFTPFDQLHTLPGRGLGLSIVQRLASLQGGDCGYLRNGANSSLFYFTLPVVKPNGL